jgi:NAD(P)-dependent dehydrogenase (short-subunit alcohol dehydrogenase family)
MSSELAGKHVVITGATGALGSAVVASLLSRGAECHVPMREATLPSHLSWRDDARVHATSGLALDEEPGVVGYYAGLPALWASVHLVGGFAMNGVAETSLDEVRAQWSLNAVTCFLCSREAVKAIRRAGQGGRIVNVTSRASVSSSPGMLSYTMAKAVVTSLTQSLAAELVTDRILVNAVSPSLIDSPANRKSMPDADFSKWPKAEEIAETIAFLAGPGNTLTSGAIVPVHGRA